MDGANIAVTIILSILGGGTLVTFLQFLITRHDNKKGKYAELLQNIKAVEIDLGNLKKEIDEDRATDARIRILQFSDEIRHKLKHSKESFDQVHLDIDMYNNYCKTHDDYRNSRAVAAIANIERVYAECLKEESFLD